MGSNGWVRITIRSEIFRWSDNVLETVVLCANVAGILRRDIFLEYVGQGNEGLVVRQIVVNLRVMRIAERHWRVDCCRIGYWMITEC